MRRGTQGKILRADDGRVIALNLGVDFVAEHEWGIKGIKSLLGVRSLSIPDVASGLKDKIMEFLGIKEPQPIGIERMRQTKDIKIEHNLDTDGFDVDGVRMWGLLVTKDNYTKLERLHARLTYYDPKREDLIGLWDGGSFAVFIDDRAVIEDFVKAIENKELAVWLGDGGLFQNAGLTIGIVSRLSEDFKEDARNVDLDAIALHRAAARTGIHKKLKDAGCRYFALSPKWSDDNKKEVVFWLNPFDQQNNNSGWYKVDDLIQWTKGVGPIPKIKQKKTV